MSADHHEYERPRPPRPPLLPLRGGRPFDAEAADREYGWDSAPEREANNVSLPPPAVPSLSGDHACSDFGTHRFGLALLDNYPFSRLEITTASDFNQEGLAYVVEDLILRLPAVRPKHQYASQAELPLLRYDVSRQIPFEMTRFEIEVIATVASGCPTMQLERIPTNAVTAGFRPNPSTVTHPRAFDRVDEVRSRLPEASKGFVPVGESNQDHRTAVGFRAFVLITDRLRQRGQLTDEVVDRWWMTPDRDGSSRADKLRFPTAPEAIDQLLTDTRVLLLQIERGSSLSAGPPKSLGLPGL